MLITHDLGVIAGLADRVLVMYAGRPVEIGTVEEIFYHPAMPYTHGLLGSLPRLDSDGTERLRQIPGSPPSMLGDVAGCPSPPAARSRPAYATREEPELTGVFRHGRSRSGRPHRGRRASPPARWAGLSARPFRRRRSPTAVARCHRATRRRSADHGRRPERHRRTRLRPVRTPSRPCWGDRPGQALPEARRGRSCASAGRR